ncbi:pentatricopeptide repeat domain protein [Fusarium beomiforme]|uniref:Pentatricopeptide repeat domain protein n=1 Tax=Fusarium beomiforme TaxID=44412 RepID=A0A9P5AAD9_9HYPO|nr:pentatricopeptide repeat domain protein [Fusarium beomiforme]
MHRIPTLFRVRQCTYSQCIKTLTQERSRYTDTTPVRTRTYNNDNSLVFDKYTESETGQQNGQLSAPTLRRARQRPSHWQQDPDKPFPLGIRLSGSRKGNLTRKSPELDAISSWERRIAKSRHSHGDQGAWETFLELQDRNQLGLLTKPRALFLRDIILKTALTKSDRMEKLFKVARHLQETESFTWPELYLKVVHFYLAQTDYETAFMWHLKLMPLFTPDLDSFGVLMASFAIDFTPKLQSTLTRIYVFSPYRELYDYVVPALFESGQSHSARIWRKRFILFSDHPKSLKSMPFLDFLSRYFSTVQLTEKELAILNRDASARDATRTSVHKDVRLEEGKGLYSDHFTARWFASSWASPEFAIDLMHRIGLRTIGPQSLQAIALREADARGVTDRLKQLRKLGIEIKPSVYCKALTSFAERDKDALLRDLLHCDIHPKEFEDPERRSALLAASAIRQNWNLERLLQEVEGLVTTPRPSPDRTLSEELNRDLTLALHRRKDLAKARYVLHRMESLDVTLQQKTSEHLLNRVFEDIWYHPTLGKQVFYGFQADPKLDRAIHTSLRVAGHGVAVPIKYWQMLLYNLGRSGRFNDLEGLSYEICELYSPKPGGLIPVHRKDTVPRPDPKIEDLEAESETWSEYYSSPGGKKEKSHFNEAFLRAEIGPPQDEIKSISRDSEPKSKSRRRSKKQKRNDSDHVFCIPADLPFTHRQHPIQKIFDISLQRAIIRWGFDITLGRQPTQPSLATLKPTGITSFDLACGVRLLAMLRDKGVYIDQQIVRSTIIKRLAAASLPGKPRARARDSRELSPKNMKRLVEEAWGSGILPSEKQLALEIERHKPKLWKSYPRLFEKSYGDDQYFI